MAGNRQDSEWCSVHLGEVTHEVTDRLGISATDMPVYGVDRMDGLTPSPKYQAANLARYKKVTPGMFAYNPMRLNIGSIGYCSSRHKLGVVSPDYVVFACRCDRLEPDYLYWLTKSASWADWVEAAGVGSVRVRIYYRELKRMPLLLPTTGEQRTIVGVLGALDDKIEQNRRTARALERLARAIFRAWFVDFEPVKAKAAGATSFPSMPQAVFDALPASFIDSEIGAVPEGWDARPYSSACIIVSGGTPKRSEPAYWNGEVPWYSVKDAPDDGEVWVINTDERITEAGVTNSAAKMVPKGCTIISARGTVGKLAMAGQPMAFNQSCYGLLPADEASFAYLHLLTQSAVAGLKQRTHGSVFDTITRATFDGLLVVAPNAGIVSSFEEIVAPLFDVLLASRQESARLAEVRDYLLPRLLNGSARVEPVNG